jgi:flagellar biosynthesis protein FlhA
MKPKLTTSDASLSIAQRSESLLSCALVGVLVVLLVPLPPVLLDLLLAFNLGLTILLMLVTLSARQPLDFSVFPSVLFLMTLLRLSLNVATTRLILLDGNAGKIVSSFGNFVVGGNLVIDLVVFLILIIIQFVVITKGAGRISEVAARFTLDAMPGKRRYWIPFDSRRRGVRVGRQVAGCNGGRRSVTENRSQESGDRVVSGSES